MILRTGDFARDIGPDELLAGFYNTVGCRLEPSGRASRFPLITGQLQEGRLAAASAPAALAELAQIETGLRTLTPAQILWHASFRTRAANAYEFFVSPDGQPLTTHLRAALEECARSGKPLQAASPGQARVQSILALVIFLIGVVWCLAGRAFFPNWMIVSAVVAHDKDGIPLWMFGFLPVAMGMAAGVGAVAPGLQVWFTRHQWASLTLAIAATLVWVFAGTHKW